MAHGETRLTAKNTSVPHKSGYIISSRLALKARARAPVSPATRSSWSSSAFIISNATATFDKAGRRVKELALRSAGVMGAPQSPANGHTEAPDQSKESIASNIPQGVNYLPFSLGARVVQYRAYRQTIRTEPLTRGRNTPS